MSETAQRRRIILATFGSPGDLQPFLAIGRELRAHGHDPIVATSAYYRETVARAGLGFAPIRPDRVHGRPDPDYLDRLLRLRPSPSALFRQMFLPALQESLADLLDVTASADAVVAHPLLAGARLAAERHGLPWISTVMQPMGFLSAFEPAVIGPPWVAASLRLAGPTVTSVVYAGARAITSRWTGEWHRLRAELGLPPVADQPLWEGAHSPLRTLGLFPRILGAPQVDWPAGARITGFPFYDDPARSLTPELTAFLDAGTPPVVFTLGTTAVNDPGTFYDESAAAARALNVRAVLVVGEGQQDRWTGNGEIIAVSYVPHALVFPRALAVVHQGGIGTLSEALRAGKPMLIMPYGHDQADNAWRARRLGVASVVPRRAYHHTRILRALNKLLDDPRRSYTCNQVAVELAREEGAATAAWLIEQALRQTEGARQRRQGAMCTDALLPPPLLP